jgi:ribonuclease HI
MSKGITRVKVFTDGSCRPNPGVGGWASLIQWKDEDGKHNEEMISGCSRESTNNIMEMTAAIESLHFIKIKKITKPRVSLTTDSEYLKNGITQWINSWRANGWRTSKRKPVKNQTEWKMLDRLIGDVEVEWSWTRSHSGHAENERVDKEAARQRRLFEDMEEEKKGGGVVKRKNESADVINTKRERCDIQYSFTEKK